MSVGRRGSPLADAVLTEDISTDEMAPGLTIMASNLEDWDGLITCVTSEARVTHGHFLHVKVTRQYWVVSYQRATPQHTEVHDFPTRLP